MFPCAHFVPHATYARFPERCDKIGACRISYRCNNSYATRYALYQYYSICSTYVRATVLCFLDFVHMMVAKRFPSGIAKYAMRMQSDFRKRVRFIHISTGTHTLANYSVHKSRAWISPWNVFACYAVFYYDALDIWLPNNNGDLYNALWVVSIFLDVARSVHIWSANRVACVATCETHTHTHTPSD